eukprot:CAMPEP_0170442280 /NCGR_PEP_ID=MMETSP0117_2-20130122/47334_1 /TAXON_ID=400756 /ORGANISM="Durinskia baltica, Strain CSIRO CS-38" /LENGTH=91 /DNA_ID=CAMNT_0010702859 /DNA_START=13 /DNA_END=285 /DNA_ORIENTATION=+
MTITSSRREGGGGRGGTATKAPDPFNLAAPPKKTGSACARWRRAAACGARQERSVPEALACGVLEPPKVRSDDSGARPRGGQAELVGALQT